jgi:5-methylcytosine-specific restriction endonuclease McrA
LLQTRYKSPSPAFNDSRDELWPDLHADGRMTRARAEELGLHRYTALDPCKKCGGFKYKLSYRKRFLNGKTEQSCVLCARIYRQNNPDKINAARARGRAAKKAATPRWLTREHHQQIRALYKQAYDLTCSTGIPHQVDHIIPLTHDFVTGLHVPWNLRVITASANASKCNKFNTVTYEPSQYESPYDP